jgi:hypothetical protein
MEKRDHSRKGVSLLSASIHYNDKTYYGVVENISANGMHAIAASRDEAAPFLPESIIEIDIDHSEHPCKGIKCEIRWVHINKTPIHGLTYRMGLEVLQSTQEFENILKQIS